MSEINTLAGDTASTPVTAAAADTAPEITFADLGLAPELLRAVLDRPIRVCGMVRNEGEPGGGPFWASNADGTQSLQIAESSQIAPADLPLMKAAIARNAMTATHHCGRWTDIGTPQRLAALDAELRA